jgi:hypothetical protein
MGSCRLVLCKSASCNDILNAYWVPDIKTRIQKIVRNSLCLTTQFKALVVEEPAMVNSKKVFKNGRSVTCQRMTCSSKCIIIPTLNLKMQMSASVMLNHQTVSAYPPYRCSRRRNKTGTGLARTRSTRYSAMISVWDTDGGLVKWSQFQQRHWLSRNVTLKEDDLWYGRG